MAMPFDLGIIDDGTEEDLGPRTAAEEFFGEFLEEGVEGAIEDKQINLKGTSATAVLAAIPYVAARGIVSLGPFAALGADPFFAAKLLTRAMFTAFASLARNSNVPRPIFNLLRSFGPVGRGMISGTLDRGRRLVLKYLDAWSKLPNPEAAMQPALGIAEGLVTFNWDKASGKTGGTPSLPASTDGTKNKNNTNNVAAALPGMGTAMYIREYLDALEKKAGTDPVALAKVDFMRGALAAYQSSSPADAADLVDASTRGLIGPEEIARALAILDADFVSSGKKDAAGNEIFISARDARLNDIVREARKRVDEAKKAADPKSADSTKKNPDEPPPGAIGPKKIPIGKHGFIDNPTWGDQPVDDGPDPGKLRMERNREEWLKKMGPPNAPRAPRTPINWNVRGRAATLWSSRNRLRILGTPFLWVWSKIVWLWTVSSTAAKARWAARSTPPTPPTPPAPPSP